MFVYTPTQFESLNPIEIGSKAYNLFELINLGFRIPSLFVINSSAFSSHVSPQDCLKSPKDIRNTINNLELSTQLIDEVKANVMSEKRYAVRSSAIGEDGSTHSFAGQLDTFLNIPASEVIEKIKQVWLSYFSDHIIAYRLNNNIDLSSVRIAVVVQEMLQAEYSGVAFSMNPVTGQRDVTIISSVYGLGEGLVSGELDADSYSINQNELNPTIEQNIAIKKMKFICDDKAKNKIVNVPVELELQNESSLIAKQVRDIVEQVNKISSYYGRPQDIEWAITKNQLFILQSRPITTLNQSPDKREQKRIWDNSNIIESYSGVTKPLTFSFIDDVYTHVYQQFCKIMGVEDYVIHANKSAFNMLGYHKGHVYYNLLNWYKVLSLFPGYSINAAFMEQMMGVKEKIDFPPNMIKSNRNEYFRLTKLSVMLVGRLAAIDKTINKFYDLLNTTLKPYQQPDFSKDNLDDLKNHYDFLERTLLAQWQAPLINDFFAMIFYGLLKNTLQKWKIDPKGTLQNDLLCGEGDIISTEPVKNIQRIANLIISNPSAKKSFESVSAKQALSIMDQWPDISQSIKDHCLNYGDRCFNELKLETITGNQDPTLIIQLIQSYLKMGYSDIQANEIKERELRTAAETKLLSIIKGKTFKKKWIDFILNKTRKLVKNRENLRFERTKVYAAVRRIFTEMGNRFYSENIIEDKRDIFYLTKEEIFSYIEGAAVQDDLKRIIIHRKNEFQEYADLTMPERFETWGPIYHANPLQMKSTTVGKEGETLIGIGCSPGIVDAEVQLIHDPNNPGELKDKILVAQHTDPGWTPLFPLSKGILVERGSLLSHSAIVAREMGIPAIVGISDLFQKLQSGDRVRFDGATGEIELLKKDNLNG